jgi:hypothetical protein
MPTDAPRPRRPRRGGAAKLRGIPPDDRALDDPELRDAAASLETHLALDLAAAASVRPTGMPATAFDEVHGLLDALSLCAADGAPFDPDAMLQRRATGWLDTTPGSLEESVVRFASAHAEPTADASAVDAGLDEQLLVPLRWRGTRGGRRADAGGSAARGARPRSTGLPGLAEELASDPLEAAARRLCAPATRLRPERGYHGPVQPSPHVASPREGAARLRPRLEALAAWAEDGARSPLLTAAVVHGALLALHPFRDANRRMALHAADRVLRRVPGAAAARTGLGRGLAEAEAEAMDAVRTAVTDGDWRGYALAFLRILADALEDTVARRRAHREAFLGLVARLEASDLDPRLRRRRFDRRRLAGAAARSPYLSVPVLVEAGVAARTTAARYLDALARAGMGVPTRLARHRLLRISTLADAVLVAPPSTPPPTPNETPGSRSRSAARSTSRRPPLDRIAAAGTTIRLVDPHDP